MNLKFLEGSREDQQVKTIKDIDSRQPVPPRRNVVRRNLYMRLKLKRFEMLNVWYIGM